jgi:tryptophan-rich sensory protein
MVVVGIVVVVVGASVTIHKESMMCYCHLQRPALTPFSLAQGRGYCC